MFSPNRIDVDDEAEVRLWADNLSLSVERLREIVALVGQMVAAVSFYARESAEKNTENARQRRFLRLRKRSPAH